MPPPTTHCIHCTRAQANNGWHQFSPACLSCGARLIASLRELKRPQADIKARQAKVLSDWQAHGHDRAELLALAKSWGHSPTKPTPFATPYPTKPLSATAKSPLPSPKG